MIEKIIRIGFLALVVLIAVALIVGGHFLGPIVKTGLETAGPKITQVSLKVDAVELTLLNGTAKVTGLVVGNPAGYRAPQAIVVGTAVLGISPLSILSDKIIVRSLRVEGAEITFEGGLGGNNLSKIVENVNAGAKAGRTAATNASAKAGSPPGKKFEVDDFLITGAKIHVQLTELGGKETTLALPEIHLTDLGKGGDGLTAADLTRRLLETLTTATIKTVAANVISLDKGAGNLGQDVNKITQGLGQLLKK